MKIKGCVALKMNGRKGKRIIAAFVSVLLVFSLAGVFAVSAEVSDTDTLIPGGMAFGVKFFTDGAIVLGTTGVETASGIISPAKDAGIRAGDIIVRAGGKEFENANELISMISGSGGKPIAIAYLRDGVEGSAMVTPARDAENGCYRIGVLVRDSTAGIGTVTFIDPKTLDFGGLGHGIYDNETATLLPLSRGAVVEVEITDVVRSERNAPGELKGSFGKRLVGERGENSEQGVFGRLSQMPETKYGAIPVAKRGEVKEGRAKVLTTLSNEGIGEYEIEIEHIYSGSGSVKNFLIKVTDERLLSKTGGIVQGMSGSPIIQNGKLVGAVTHVLVDDPTRGYGIFIGNMLDSAFDASASQESNLLAA